MEESIKFEFVCCCVIFCVCYNICACTILLWNGTKYFVSKCMKHNIINFCTINDDVFAFCVAFSQKEKCVRVCVCTVYFIIVCISVW